MRELHGKEQGLRTCLQGRGAEKARASEGGGTGSVEFDEFGSTWEASGGASAAGMSRALRVGARRSGLSSEISELPDDGGFTDAVVEVIESRPTTTAQDARGRSEGTPAIATGSAPARAEFGASVTEQEETPLPLGRGALRYLMQMLSGSVTAEESDGVDAQDCR